MSRNALEMSLALIPAGAFLMGATPAQIGDMARLDSNFHVRTADNEEPQHRVQISQPFYLGIYEVTKGQ